MRVFLVTLLLLFTIGCNDVFLSPTTPASLPTTNPSPIFTQIEFRVTGTATSARVKFSNAQDGLTQVVTSLPYTATMTTKESSLFLSLEGTPTVYNYNSLYPFFAVQIFVNGNLFREATSSDFVLSTLSVSGTWRK